MKLMIIRVIAALLIAAGLGLYVYGIVVNGVDPTQNLLRTVVIALSGVSALMKTFPKRRALSEYASAYQKELGSAFSDEPKKREELLNAVRLFDEDKNQAALKQLEKLRMEARTRDEIYAVGIFTALCYEGLGLNDAAIAAYRETARKGAPSSQLYSNLGMLYSGKDPQQAADCYMKAIELDPSNPLPHSNIANLMLRLGEYDGAAHAATNAVELNPSQYQAWTVLAIVANIRGDDEGCEACVRKAVSAGQNEEALRGGIAHYTHIAQQNAVKEA